MASFTVNTLLCYEKNLKSRVSQLKELAEQSTKKTSWMMDNNRVEEPTCDIKELDKKIVRLSKALLDIDMAIKTSNAKTKVEIAEFDYDTLMAPLES
jgi:hypothetical protein